MWRLQHMMQTHLKVDKWQHGIGSDLLGQGLLKAQDFYRRCTFGSPKLVVVLRNGPLPSYCPIDIPESRP